MMIRSLVAAAWIGLALLAAARAENAPGEGEDDRFIFKRVDDGFVRLDTRTGQVALCSRHSVGWACEAMPEERAALEGEIARLQRENAGLKKALLTHGIDLPGVKPEKPPERGGKPGAGQGGRHGVNPPGDADVDRVMALLGKAWQGLVDLMASLRGRG